MSVSAPSVNVSHELLAAVMANRQQKAQGQAALELVQGVAQTAPSATPAKSASGSIGSNIDIHV